MLGYIIIGAIAFICGGFLCWFPCRKKLSARQEYNQRIADENEKMALENQKLSKQRHCLENDIKSLQFNEQQQIGKLKGLEISIQTAENQAKDAAEKFYNQQMQMAQEKFAHAVETEAHQYQETISAFEENLKIVQAETVGQLELELAEKQAAIKQAESALNDMKNKVASAVQASKRAEEMISQQNFYRIQLSEIDIDEIEKLRSVEPYLRDKEPLNKVIWKVYYEKPTNDLIGRVIGPGTHTGIYKITNIESQKCYVGQAANLADRWKQHIKRGVGADAPTRNKLYPAMRELGPENFTFEVVEECDRSLLDSREDYWQDYFKAKEFGYSIK